ncbi:MAG: hypothetical protein ACR2GR_12830 [Rhodothermales bacterium]
MKKMHVLPTLSFLGIVLLAAPTASGQQTDSTVAVENVEEATGEKAQRLFENEYAEVMRVALAPGDSLPRHEGGPRVAYALGAYTIRFQQGGQDVERSFSQGDVHFHEAGVHTVENVGDSTAAFVVFERREAELPSASAVEAETDLGEEAPAKEEELLSNEAFEVHEVTLEPGQRLPDHTGYARIVHALSDYKVMFMQDGEETTQSFSQGDVHFHEAGPHALRNAGDMAAEFLVVELKP